MLYQRHGYSLRGIHRIYGHTNSGPSFLANGSRCPPSTLRHVQLNTAVSADARCQEGKQLFRRFPKQSNFLARTTV